MIAKILQRMNRRERILAGAVAAGGVLPREFVCVELALPRRPEIHELKW